MYYKVMSHGRVIDVLDNVVYLKYQPKHGIMVICDIDEAQAILLSDGETILHEVSLYDVPCGDRDWGEVVLIEIDEFEYKQRKALQLSTPDEIIDEFLLSLFEAGVI